MKVLYGAPFTPEEARMVTDVIRANVLATMQALVEGCDAYGLEIADTSALAVFRADVGETAAAAAPDAAARRG